MGKNLVTICVITYNSSLYVKETLESILNQDYENIEVIISDDCSTDNTPQICREWVVNNERQFNRCIFTHTPYNKGITGNYNHALTLCRGEWIKYIAGDDILRPNCISEFMKEVDDQLQIMCCLKEDFYDDGRPRVIKRDLRLKAKNQLKEILITFCGNIVCGATLFINRKYLCETGGMDEQFKYLEDYPLCMKYMINGGRIKLVEKVLVEYRRYNNSVSVSNMSFIQNVNDAINEYVPQAALKCGMLFYWYEFKVNQLLNIYIDKKYGILFRILRYTSPKLYLNWIKYRFRYIFNL